MNKLIINFKNLNTIYFSNKKQMFKYNHLIKFKTIEIKFMTYNYIILFNMKFK
jgi:hypothetical protein